MVSLKDIAEEAKAAQSIIDSVSGILATASRSVVVEVTNASSRTLRHSGNTHPHGALAKLPAETILPMQSDVFGARSSEGGIMTGTTGRVSYSLDDEGTTLVVHWEVPFIGGNESRSFVWGPHESWYTTSDVISGGNKKVPARFIVGERASLGPTDADWITCGKCKALFYRLDRGVCPGDVTPGHPVEIGIDGQTTFTEARYGAHEGAGSLIRLSHSVPGPSREGGWRKCKRCRQLFFDGWDDKGACPKWESPRPGHVAEDGGHEYFLQFDLPPRPMQQNDWRFCTKCFVLFYLPHNPDGDCAAGGRHHAHAYNYVIDRVT